MASDILEAVIFKFRGFERKPDFRTRHRWSEWNFRRNMTNYGLDPFHATNNHEKQITWNVPHSPPPRLYKEMKSERLWFWSFILLCLSLFLISLFDTAIIVFCRFCDIIMYFVLSDDIDYKRGFKITYTHALTHSRTHARTYGHTRTIRHFWHFFHWPVMCKHCKLSIKCTQNGKVTIDFLGAQQNVLLWMFRTLPMIMLAMYTWEAFLRTVCRLILMIHLVFINHILITRRPKFIHNLHHQEDLSQ